MQWKAESCLKTFRQLYCVAAMVNVIFFTILFINRNVV